MPPVIFIRKTSTWQWLRGLQYNNFTTKVVEKVQKRRLFTEVCCVVGKREKDLFKVILNEVKCDHTQSGLHEQFLYEQLYTAPTIQ